VVEVYNEKAMENEKPVPDIIKGMFEKGMAERLI